MRVFERDEFRPPSRRLCDSIEEAQVARRPDVEDRIAGSFFDQSDRHVARSYDSVERLRGNAKPQHLSADGRRWPWSVGDEDDRAATAAKRYESFRCERKRGHPIVQDAPNVAENCVIAIRDLAETADLPDDLCVFLPIHRALG